MVRARVHGHSAEDAESEVERGSWPSKAESPGHDQVHARWQQGVRYQERISSSWDENRADGKAMALDS